MYDTQHDLIDAVKAKGYDSYYDSFGNSYRISKNNIEYKVIIRGRLTVIKSGNIIYDASIPETKLEIDVFIKLVL